MDRIIGMWPTVLFLMDVRRRRRQDGSRLFRLVTAWSPRALTQNACWVRIFLSGTTKISC